MMRVNQVRLPSEYQEVEYIENNGTAYILTGLSIKDGYRHQMKVRFLVAANADTYPGVSGGYLGPDSGISGGHARLYLVGLQTNGKVNYGYLGNYGDIGSGYITGVDYTIDYSWISGNAFVKVNGTTLQSSSATYSTSKPGVAMVGGMAHMDQAVGSQYGANPGIRIYYSQFYNASGTLVRDFIPCYRIADGEIGMYDLVNDQFYTNSGTGTFTKGNDVPDMEEKQVRPQKTIIYDDDVSLSTGSGGYAYTTITITAPSTNISFKLNCTSLEGPSTNPYGPVYGPTFSFNGTTVYSGALPITVGGELEDTFTISGTGTITCTIDYRSSAAWARWNGHLTVYAS